jgi:hypothetical protein
MNRLERKATRRDGAPENDGRKNIRRRRFCREGSAMQTANLREETKQAAEKVKNLSFRRVPFAEESLLGTPISRLAGFVKNANRQIGVPRKKKKERFHGERHTSVHRERNDKMKQVDFFRGL